MLGSNLETTAVNQIQRILHSLASFSVNKSSEDVALMSEQDSWSGIFITSWHPETIRFLLFFNLTLHLAAKNKRIAKLLEYQLQLKTDELHW